MAGDRCNTPVDRGDRRHCAAADGGLAHAPTQRCRHAALMLQRPNPPLILASASASRRALLATAGLRFEIRPADIDEAAVKQEAQARGASAEKAALRLADLKAAAVAGGAPEAIVIGADQILVC